MDAIIYCSQTGHTARYARLLAEAAGLHAFSLSEARAAVKPGSSVLFLGWILAGSIRGYEKAAQRWQIAAVAAVGMAGPEADQRDSLQQRHKLPSDLPLFYLRGGYAPSALRGLPRLMMRVMARSEIKRLEALAGRTPEEDVTLQMWRSGADFVSETNLRELLQWFHAGA